MADGTFSFKVEDELREKVQILIKASGMTSKEWFQKAVALAELQSVKEVAVDYASDLKELEMHTARIYELVSNMVQKSIYLKDDAVGDLKVLLEKQREITTSLQSELNSLKELKNHSLSELEVSLKEKSELEKQIAELRETLETNKLLINEYKEKNHKYTELVAKYEGYTNEYEMLSKTLADEQISYQLKIAELSGQNHEKEASINELIQQTERLTEAHKTALERLEERKGVEQEKALLVLEREYQKAQTNANNEYSHKLNELYEKMDKQRLSYEKKIEDLQSQLTLEMTKNNKIKKLGSLSDN